MNIPDSKLKNRTQDKQYLSIVEACESDFRRFGDDFRGVSWTKSKENADRRYHLMLELLKENEECTLLDVGCGLSHLLEFINQQDLSFIRYSGLDLSALFLRASKEKFPNITYYQSDILESSEDIPKHDYIIMNGLFTAKETMSYDEMWMYCQKMLCGAFALCNKGFAFNVMSKYVDWERDDLFHLEFDVLAQFLDKEISRYFSIRHDYGLFEYTVYVYRKPFTLKT